MPDIAPTKTMPTLIAFFSIHSGDRKGDPTTIQKRRAAGRLISSKGNAGPIRHLLGALP